MDLQDLTIYSTVPVEIRHPKVGKTDVVIHLYSPASDSVIEFNNRVTERNIKKLSKNKPTYDTAEGLEKQAVDRLIAFTASIENLTNDGKDITLNNIREVYENPVYGWLTEQLFEKIGDWDSFLA